MFQKLINKFFPKKYLIWISTDYYRDMQNNIVVFDSLPDAKFIMNCKFPNGKIHTL